MNILRGASTLKKVAVATVAALVTAGAFTGLAVTNSGPFSSSCGPAHGVALGVGTPAGACPAPGSGTPGNCPGLANGTAAFCDTFDQPAGTGNRSGQLNGNVWGVSRNRGGSGNWNSGQGLFDGWVNPTTEFGSCGGNIQTGTGGTSVGADATDLSICNGQLNDTTDDNDDITASNLNTAIPDFNGDVTSLAMYPKQRFDWSGSTLANPARVVFDVSDDSGGTHDSWPEFWISNLPVPDPFVHFSSWQSLPQYAIGIRLDAVCAPPGGCGLGACPTGLSGNTREVSVQSADFVNNYQEQDGDGGATGGNVFDTVDGVNLGFPNQSILNCVLEPSVGSGQNQNTDQLNHFEVDIDAADNRIDVYGTNAFSGALNLSNTPLVHLFTATPNASFFSSLGFTSGLVWIEDDHYNGNKNDDTGSGGAPIPQALHTYTWDNVGFTGPVDNRDLTFDVPDPLSTVSADPARKNLGFYGGGSNDNITVNTLPVSGISQAAAGFLMFTLFAEDLNCSPGATNPVGCGFNPSLTYSLNGHTSHVYAWPFPWTLANTELDYAIPINLAELTTGVNTITIGNTNVEQSGESEFFSNLDIVLAGAGGPGGGGATTTTTTTTASTTTTTTGAPPGNVSVRVSGNKLVTASGATFIPHGVDKDGTEYACVQTPGPANTPFDGPADSTSVMAMTTWDINIVRIPLNEDCWLGINGAPFNGLTASQYQTDIINYVDLLHTYGMAAILELHVNAPGTTLSTAQQEMPDSDHAPAFWTSVANTFKADPGVLFDLYNEPYPDNNQDTTAAWTCWLNGGSCPSVSFPVAGMQTLTNAVRSTGSTNVIMLGGVQFSNALDQWLTYKPTDSANQTAASFHVYSTNVCNTVTCWNAGVAPVAAQFPVISGEIGEGDQAATFINTYMSWADSLGIGYLAWTWDDYSPCSSSIVLISDYTGTACPGYGVGYEAHLQALSNALVSAPATWSNVTSNLSGMTSECGNLTNLWPVPNTNEVIAGVAASGLWESANAGASWTQLDQGGGAAPITNRPADLVFDPTTPATWWEAGIYGSTFGVMKTTNNGSTFSGLGSEFDDNTVSIDFSDPLRQTLLDGGHETRAQNDLSTNGGTSWTNVWPTLSPSIGGAFTQFVLVINSTTALISAYIGYNGGTAGLYRTTNLQMGASATWTKVSTLAPNAIPLVASNGTIYWALNNSLLVSSNQGVSWTQVGTTAGIATDSGTGQGIEPVQLPAPDNRLVTIGTSNTLIVSADGGVTWSNFGATFPTVVDGRTPEDVIYSPANKAFFISHWDCSPGTTVPIDAVEKGV